MVVPEGVAQVEEASLHLDVGTLLEGALPVGGAVKGAVLYQQVPAAVEGPLLIEDLLLNDFHIGVSPCAVDPRNFLCRPAPAWRGRAYRK